ncbi:hypothetical protein BH09VER1_BH09VER1_13410 [soil metagenome]
MRTEESSEIFGESSMPLPVEPAGVLAFPSALAQEAFYYLEQLRPGVAPFNVAVRFRLEGAIDLEILRRSFETVMERHEALRTQFEDDGGELMQIVLPAVKLPYELIDISELPGEEKAAELERLGLAEAQMPFDLHKAPLIRVLIVRLATHDHMMHISIHHAVSDGWSIGVLNDELSAIYNALARNEAIPLAPLEIQYADYAIWQRDFLAGPDIGPQIAYWKERLDGVVDLDLPTDHPRPPVKKWNGDIVSELLPMELTDRLKELARENGATLFHVFLATFNILLARYAETTDVAVCSPVAGRTRPELEPLIGVFINSVILRTDLSGNPDFHTVLQRTRDTAVEAMAHQDVPFEALVRELRPGRDASRNPLSQINFTHQRAFIKPIEYGDTFDGVKISGVPSLSPGAIFDLHFFTVERENMWRVSCDFCTDLYERSTAVRMLGHFRMLLEEIASGPDSPVGTLSLLTVEEARQIAEWRGTKTEYPRDATIGSLFVEVATRHADKVALSQGNREITYGQLHSQASRLAARLRAEGVQPGSMVAITASHSIETMAGLIAIALAGGAYTPVDPNHPEERIRFIMDDVGASILLVDSAVSQLQPDVAHRLITLERMDGKGDVVEIDTTGLTALHPAYVLYTSGSTGRPKGVVVPHRAVTRLVWGTDFMKFGPDEVFLQAAPLSFDASTLEIWGPLLNGGKLVLLEANLTGLVHIANTVRTREVTTLWLTAGLFQIMVDEHLDDLKGLRNLLAGGDVLPIAHVRRAFEALPKTRLINGYGPTENTTFTTCHTIGEEDLQGASISIGRPIANTTVVILDQEGQPVPAGIPGEILTGGDGLALGYLNNAELTAVKFVVNPVRGYENEILYRTGDRGRWRADGTIEFLGRRDRQAKIRGVRIEPAEVEEAISSHPSVGGCKADVRGGSAGNKTLVAWVNPAAGAMIDRQELADYLASKLPPFLCPDSIVVLDSLPLTENGKIDGGALPDPSHEARTRSTPPRTETEKELAAIWCELLELPAVGRDDNFFHLGGHSLLGLKLFSRILKNFKVSLPLATLLKAPTLRTLAIALDAERLEISEKSQGTRATIAPIQRDGELPPFFCIHGGDGGVIFYRNLAAHLSPDRPLLAIEAPALVAENRGSVASVEETAEEYVRLITKRQSRGPYYLGGYSFGGTVAYEMARLLRAEGEEVAFLAIFDALNPTVRLTEYTLSERVRRFWNAHREKGPLGRAQKVLAHGIKRAGRRVLPERPIKERPMDFEDERTREINEAHRKVLQAYRPGPLDGKMTLFRAAQEDGIFKMPPDFGWGPLVRELEVVVVPGHHMTMFEAGNVEVLGAKLRKAFAALPVE